MDATFFEARLARRQLMWDVALTFMVALAALAGGCGYWAFYGHEFATNPLGAALNAIFSVAIGVGIVLIILRPINYWLERTWLKGYWIEDCGDVIKLHGSYRGDGYGRACRDLLAVRPGMMIDKDAWKNFQCTLAAIPASPADLRAKAELEAREPVIKSQFPLLPAITAIGT